jgi:hypothetical protein
MWLGSPFPCSQVPATGSISWARCIHSTPSHPFSLRSILILSSHLRLCLPNSLFLQVFQPILPIRALCPAHLIVLDLITVAKYFKHSKAYVQKPEQNSKMAVTVLNYLTLWGGVLLEKLMVSQLVKKFPHCIELESSLECSQEPATSTYPAPSTLSSWEWSLLFRFSNQILYAFLISPMPATCPTHHTYHPPWYDRPNNNWWSVQVMKLDIIQCSSASRSFNPLTSKYSQRSVLDNRQVCFRISSPLAPWNIVSSCNFIT